MRLQMRQLLHPLAWLVLVQCVLVGGSFEMAASRRIERTDWMIRPLFETAVTNLNKGGTRRQAADQFERIARDYPGSLCEDRAREYAKVLKRMSEEDAAFRMPTNLATLPTQAQVETGLSACETATQSNGPGRDTPGCQACFPSQPTS